MKQRKGYILLLSVLAVGAVGTAIATSILILSVGNNLNSLAEERSAQALFAATACAENALEELRLDVAYTGNETLTLSEGTCTIGVIGGTGANNRTIQVTGTVATVVRKIEIVVSDVGPPTVILSWQDVDDFTVL